MKDKLRTIVFLLILIIFSAILIFYKYQDIPKNYTIDEIAFAHLVLSLDGKPYTPFSTIADGHATLYFYTLLANLKFLGDNRYGLRLPSAIFGILGVVFFYLIMEKIFGKNKYLPFLLTVIFVTLHWYLNFARFAFEAPFLMFLELTAIYFFLQNSFFLSGIFSGLAFNSYQPGRIFFLLPLFFLIYKVVKQLNSLTIKQLLFFLIPFIIVISPLAIYLVTNSKNDVRIQQELYFNDPKLAFQQKINYFGQNIVKTALMFDFKGDLTGRHNYPGKPAINPFLGILFIAGLILAIIRRNKLYNQFFLFYFILALIPTLFTYPQENPNMLRTFTAIAPVAYFVGLSIEKLIKFRKKLFGAIVILIILSCTYELRTYFYYEAQVFPDAFRVKSNLKTGLKNFQQFQYNFNLWQNHN